MGNLVFQATLGGQVNLVGPNTASTFNLNVPATSSTIATLTGTETFTNKTLTSPTLTTPVLGTPSSGTLTNCTGLPNAGLVNSSVTVGSTAIALGATATTVAGLTSLATNTLTSAASTALTLQSAGTTAVTIDTSQNVGIGTTPSAKLDIVGTAAQITNGTGASGSRVRLDAPASSGGSYIELYKDLTPSYVAGIGTVVPGGSAASAMIFSDYQGSWVERMRIDSSGNLLVGTTSASAKVTVIQAANSPATDFYTSGGSIGTPCMYVKKQPNDGSTSQVYIQFLYNNASSGNGQINGNGGGSSAFGSYSDIRLKENVVNLPSQLANIMALRPVEFDWKDGNGHQIGFIAQEVQEVYPDLVGVGADEMLTLTDMNKNDARLIKAIQELKAINDTQAETINALTARIVAMENK